MNKESSHHTLYPHLDRFSRQVGIPAASLVRAFEIERKFHEDILQEPDPQRRKQLYAGVYQTVHEIYGKKAATDQSSQPNPKDRLVKLFRRELSGKSILDIGCGQGHFLLSVHRQLPHGAMTGIDISTPVVPKSDAGVEFNQGDVVEFDLDRKYDVAFSDQVMEHIAPSDLTAHLNSIRRILKDGGVLIINMPNRLFGPSDVTRIIDCSYTGRVPAQGTHLNESTYTEMAPILARHGFSDIRTVFPFHYIRYWLWRIRLRPGILQWIERNRAMLNLLRAIRFRGACVARFDVVLICRKDPDVVER